MMMKIFYLKFNYDIIIFNLNMYYVMMNVIEWYIVIIDLLLKY